MTWWFLSRNTLPCIWPESPMPATEAGLIFPSFRTFLTLRADACHQSSGSCSDHPGRGLDRGYSNVALATIRPFSRIARVLVPLVPMSMPR